MSFTMDLGEIEEFLRTMHGVAQGFAGEESIQVSGIEIRRAALDAFGEHADAAAAVPGSSIGHVYEWGSTTNRKIANASIRLWHVLPGGSTGANATIQLGFLKSTARVPIENDFGLTERAKHIWEEKAHEQEYDRSWKVYAGRDAKTRISPGISKALIIPDGQGGFMFRQSWINYSDYTGNFTSFFQAYWATDGIKEIEHSLQQRLEKEFKPEVERMMNERMVRARRIPANIADLKAPVNVRVRGRPMRPGGLDTKPPREVVRRTHALMKRIVNRGGK